MKILRFPIKYKMVEETIIAGHVPGKGTYSPAPPYVVNRATTESTGGRGNTPNTDESKLELTPEQIAKRKKYYDSTRLTQPEIDALRKNRKQQAAKIRALNTKADSITKI